jgi:hypothetical protein
MSYDMFVQGFDGGDAAPCHHRHSTCSGRTSTGGLIHEYPQVA